MKNKEQYQTKKKDLKKYYNFVYTCENCGSFYGCDLSSNTKYKLCPFCERDLFLPRGVKKKK